MIDDELLEYYQARIYEVNRTYDPAAARQLFAEMLAEIRSLREQVSKEADRAWDRYTRD